MHFGAGSRETIERNEEERIAINCYSEVYFKEVNTQIE